MTRIVYKIKDGWGEAREFSGEGGTLSLEIEPAPFGYVTVGGCTSEIVDGRALFDLGRISDGEYTPLVSGEIHAELEPIKKQGGRVALMPTSDKTVRKMLVRLEHAEERIAALSLRVDKLSELYGKQVIF